ncbi:MAG: MFS transporter [Alphaproteobacteria bacterium]|nr:MFS transporter [Alphaproteobacteria bacterium]
MTGAHDGAADRGGPRGRLLRRIAAVEPPEMHAVLWCWLTIFSVMTSYYIMRPMRDQMGVAGGVNQLQWLFTGTLAGMLLVNLPFGWLVKKLPRSRFIALSYRFFALNILVFAGALYLATPEQTVWIGRVFFIWASVYNLFVISLFWQLNVDLFTPEQGKRLFGFIAAGASVGAVSGSTITATLAKVASPTALLIGAAVLLEVAVFSAGRLAKLSPALRQAPTPDAAARGDERAIGGSMWAGITHIVRSPYLATLSLFMLLFAITSTFVYFEQAAIVRDNFPDRASQTQFFATIDLAVNALTLATQLFFTGRIVGWLGVPVALALLPAISIAGFSVLAAMPGVAAIAVFQVIRRAGDYAIARPTREVLFTVVAREDRFKAKGVIDTLVYRLGDQIGAWTMPLLAVFGARSTAFAAIALGIVWLGVSLWLGRRQRALEGAEPVTLGARQAS